MLQVKEEGSDQQGMISEYSLTNIDPENPSIHYQLATELQIDKKSRTLPAVTVRDVGIECSVNAPLNETLPSIRNENSHEESLTQASEETEILEQQKKITELEDLLAVIYSIVFVKEYLKSILFLKIDSRGKIIGNERNLCWLYE